jgi:hypothetical protein
MWRCIQEVATFAEGFDDELVSAQTVSRWNKCGLLDLLVIVQIPESLFKVSHPSVHQLCALAAGSTAEVIALDKRNFQASGDCIKRNASSRRTAADDQKVIWFVIRLLLCSRLRIGAQQVLRLVYSLTNDAAAALEVRNLVVAAPDVGKFRWSEDASFAICGRWDSGSFCARDIARSVCSVEGDASNGANTRRIQQRPENAASPRSCSHDALSMARCCEMDV